MTQCCAALRYRLKLSAIKIVTAQIGREVQCVQSVLEVHSADWWLGSGPQNSKIHSVPLHRLVCSLTGRTDLVLVSKEDRDNLAMFETVSVYLILIC